MKVQQIHDFAVNPNPVRFQNLVACVATVGTHFVKNNGSVDEILNECERVFRQRLTLPPNYAEITELSGEGSNPNDRNAGRGAWLLANTANLQVHAVHSNLFEKLPARAGFDAPVLRTLAKRLNVPFTATSEHLAELGRAVFKSGSPPKLSVLGIVGRSIWVVQTVSASRLAAELAAPQNGMFEFAQTRVFDAEVIEETTRPLTLAVRAIRKLFPNFKVVPLVLMTHLKQPHLFELYRLPHFQAIPSRHYPEADAIVDSSISYQEELDADAESLWRMQGLLDNELFQGLPPCRGSRTLCLLAAIATQQLASEELLTFTEVELGELYRNTFGYQVSRDKVRHDIGDRLIAQWFVKRQGGQHFLTVHGLARYLYSLAKYTSRGPKNAAEILETCTEHGIKVATKFIAA